MQVAEDLKSLKLVDGIKVRQDENELLQAQTKNFDDLMNTLFKEDREKAAAKAEADKNAKKGPAKDDKKKDDKKKDDKKVDDKKQEKPGNAAKLVTMGSLELVNDQMGKFELTPDVTNPFKIRVSIRTLEKAETVFFEELADDPNLKKEDYQTSYWVEFDLSRHC